MKRIFTGNAPGCTRQGKRVGARVPSSTPIRLEAERRCDRVASVNRGTAQACGTLAALRERYREEEVEALLFNLVSEKVAAKASVHLLWWLVRL